MFLMEGGNIVENFENLWFFSNVLSSPPPTTTLPPPSPTKTVLEKINNAHLSDSPESNLQDPKFPDLQAVQVQDSNSEDQSQTGPEFKFELKIVESVTMGELKSPELVKEQRSRTERMNHKNKSRIRRRKAKGLKEQQKFRDFGCFTSGHDGFEGRKVPLVPRFQIYLENNTYLGSNIPPLSDCIAMKQHLRSWAHAVACTVR